MWRSKLSRCARSGPKLLEVKLTNGLKRAAKKGVNALERKRKEILGDSDDAGGNAIKKRKIKTPASVKAKSIKRSLSHAR